MQIEGFHFPDDRLYLVEDQTWGRLLDDGTVEVGITALGLAESGELYMCRPKPVGSRVEQGRSVAVVELAKAIVSVRSPLSGVVVAINEPVSRTPELVNRDPYGAGWLARLQPDDFPRDRLQLQSGQALPAAIAAYRRRAQEGI